MTRAAAVYLVGKEQRDDPARCTDGADKRSASALLADRILPDISYDSVMINSHKFRVREISL